MNDSLSVAIVKPVGAKCNLSCSYCYMQCIDKAPSPPNMTAETLKKLIDFFCRDLKKVEFIWHGGEPLLAGISFYEEALKQQRKWLAQGTEIQNFIQSNVTLVTKEWAMFCAKNHMLVGTSVDAPAHVHERTRRFKNRKSSLNATVRGIKLLEDAGVFNGVICCVGSHNWDSPAEVIDFFISMNIKKLKFLRIREPFSGSINRKQHIDFMISIFKKWLEIDDPEIEIRDIKSLVEIPLGGNIRECIFTGRCDRFATVYSDGSIYPCDNFPKSSEFCFGNIEEGRETICQNENFKRFLKSLRSCKEECEGCEWFKICQGGCFYQRLLSNSVEEYCSQLKRLFSEVHETLHSCRLI